ncbi:hypothetical protein [Streptomyces diacarni]|uniref:hypothetical protein n=1 Tax=Streptomyces diacarni TaxID=2800381 RepID=UPI0015F0B7A1|nr:hypothetical protein [Streptomyces diacarni]
MAPAPAASPRMRQVASELDELGALLRGDQQAPGERPGDDPRRQPGPWGRA